MVIRLSKTVTGEVKTTPSVLSLLNSNIIKRLYPSVRSKLTVCCAVPLKSTLCVPRVTKLTASVPICVKSPLTSSTPFVKSSYSFAFVLVSKLPLTTIESLVFLIISNPVWLIMKFSLMVNEPLFILRVPPLI